MSMTHIFLGSSNTQRPAPLAFVDVPRVMKVLLRCRRCFGHGKIATWSKSEARDVVGPCSECSGRCEVLTQYGTLQTPDVTLRAGLRIRLVYVDTRGETRVEEEATMLAFTRLCERARELVEDTAWTWGCAWIERYPANPKASSKSSQRWTTLFTYDVT
jgi:hypothetical protein